MHKDPIDTTPHRFANNTTQMLATALTALVLSFGLLFGVRYVGQQQTLENQAATGQTIQLRMNGNTSNNNEFHVDLYLNSKGYDVVGTQVSGKVTGVNASDVSIDLNNSLNLQSIGSKVVQSGSDAQFDFTQFAPMDTTKRVNTHGQEAKFATLTVKKNKGGSFTINLNKAKTAVPVVGNSAITLDAMLTRSFTVGNYVATQATPTPSPAVRRSCNESCADKNECAAGYSCFNSRCRNPVNLTSESCSAAPTPQPTPKPTPKVTYIPAATPKPASQYPTPTPVAAASPSPSPSPSTFAGTLFASPTVSASPSGTLYDENSLRVSPSPIIKKASPSPTTTTTAQSATNKKLLTAGIIVLVALVIVVPIGIYLYRRVR